MLTALLRNFSNSKRSQIKATRKIQSKMVGFAALSFSTRLSSTFKPTSKFCIRVQKPMRTLSAYNPSYPFSGNSDENNNQADALKGVFLSSELQPVFADYTSVYDARDAVETCSKSLICSVILFLYFMSGFISCLD